MTGGGMSDMMQMMRRVMPMGMGMAAGARCSTSKVK